MDPLPTLAHAPIESQRTPANAAFLPPVMPGGGAIPLPQKCKCGVCPTCQKRAKWRAKYYAKKERAGEIPATPPGTVESPNSPGVASAPAPVVIPHNPDDWKPVAETLVAIGEKTSVTVLVSKAEKLNDAALLKDIREGAPWNVTAKETVIRTAPPILAKAAEKIGLPAEAANLTMLCAALGQIALHHAALSSKLDKAIERIEEATKKAEQARA
jgi:hypothetical protein